MIRNFLKKYKRVLILFLSVKLGLVVLIAATYPLFPFSLYDYQVNGYQAFQNPGILEKHMAAYDGHWYLHIAKNGYRNFPDANIQVESYAFFPLYPLLIRLVSFLLAGNLAIAALFISLVSAFVGTIVLYKLIRIEFDEKISRYTTLYFLITPSAIFFLAAYTESLFFMITIAAWYFIRTQRWHRSALCAYIAALTRPQGVFLFIPFVIEYFQTTIKSTQPRRKKILAGLSLFGAPLGLFTYYSFLYFETGNFFTHLIINNERWGRGSVDVVQMLGLIVDRIANFSLMPFHAFHYSQLDTIFLIFSLLLLAPMMVSLRLSYALWALILVTLPLSTGIMTSITRYISLSFPHYLIFALFTYKRPVARSCAIAVSAALAGLLAIRFVHWYWAG